MNKHYKEALIEATVEHLQENCGEENIDRELLNNIVDTWEEDNESTFDEDIDSLTQEYLEQCDDEPAAPEKTPEETIEEAIEKLHVGFNFVPGIGVGYCKDEEDLTKMKEFIRGGMSVAAMMSQMFGF